MADLQGVDVPNATPLGRMAPCQSCHQPYEVEDMVSIGTRPTHCWPCWMRIVDASPRIDSDSWRAVMPAGWYQRCERCDVLTWITQDRPLCAECRRLPTKWRRALSICAECGRACRRKGQSAARCWAPDARGRRMIAARRLGTHTAAEWRAKLAEHDYRCAYCGAAGQGLSKDHVIPVSRGGSDGIENVVPACTSCNSSKSNRPLSEWLLVRFPADKNLGAPIVPPFQMTP